MHVFKALKYADGHVAFEFSNPYSRDDVPPVFGALKKTPDFYAGGLLKNMPALTGTASLVFRNSQIAYVNINARNAPDLPDVDFLYNNSHAKLDARIDLATKELYISDVYIQNHYRKQGYGAQLLLMAMDIGNLLKLETIRLTTADEGRRAWLSLDVIPESSLMWRSILVSHFLRQKTGIIKEGPSLNVLFSAACRNALDGMQHLREQGGDPVLKRNVLNFRGIIDLTSEDHVRRVRTRCIQRVKAVSGVLEPMRQ